MPDPLQFLGLLGLTAGGGLAINSAMDRLSSIGEQAQLGTTLDDGTVVPGAQQIAQAGLEQTQFQPFGVTTASGSTFGYDPTTGRATTGLSGTEQGIQDALFGQAGGAFGAAPAGQAALQGAAGEVLSGGREMFGQTPFGMGGIQDASGQAFGLGSQFMQQAGMGTADREAAIYDRIRAMQAPGEERDRMALEERLASQGRLGVQTNQYGGTPEQLAMAKAQSEAQNTAAYQAIQQAQREQAQQAGLGAQYAGLGAGLAGQGQDLSAAQQAQALQAMQAGQGLYSGALGLEGAQQALGLQALQGAYQPQQQATAAMQAAQLFPQLAQRGQLYGAGLFGEASMGGLEAMLGAELGRANLLGNVGTGLLGGVLSGGQDSLFGGILGF